ncbi:MAG TPA: nuclear transport factor 2 family protein [Trebonia sp.]
MTLNDNAAPTSGLADEAAIRNITARFADIVMRADYDAFSALWSDDAAWVIGGTEGQPFERRAHGVDSIVSLFRDLWKGNDYFVHFAVPGIIAIDGDQATAQVVCHEAARGPERFYRTHGIWSDQLRRTGSGGWVFTNRTYRYLWLDMSPFTGDTFPILP